mgnify:CR=1 FL=1
MSTATTMAHHGRPAMHPARRHSDRVRVCLTAAMHAEVRRRARRHGQSVSGWLRDVVLAELAKTSE